MIILCEIWRLVNRNFCSCQRKVETSGFLQRFSVACYISAHGARIVYHLARYQPPNRGHAQRVLSAPFDSFGHPMLLPWRATLDGESTFAGADCKAFCVIAIARASTFTFGLMRKVVK